MTLPLAKILKIPPRIRLVTLIRTLCVWQWCMCVGMENMSTVITQETTQYAVTLSTHNIKCQGLVSMENIAYISILQKSEVWERNSKGYCVSGAYMLSHFHTQTSKVAVAHLFSPVCVCSYHCKICTR